MIPWVVQRVTVTGATLIPSTGNALITHYVTPQGSGNVTLTAVISPDTPRMRGKLVWEGGGTAVPGDPLSVTVPKTGFAKTELRIKVGGLQQADLRVWVVWATIATTDIPITYTEPTNLAGAGPGAFITGGFNFTHTIRPTAVITDADRPNLSGPKTVDPPGGNHPLTGAPLSGGANRKWDNSRQIRAKILNPNSLPNTAFAQPAPVAVAAFPAGDVTGNDDRTPNDETNDPYTNGGLLTGSDSPGMGIDNSAGANGDTWERRLNFREFTRVELAGTWHRCSDFFPWRIYVKFRKAGGKWVDNGTDKATDNAGF
jgi:hypothetical protein